MTEDQLARWLSEYPNLIGLVERNPKMRDYLSSRRPKQDQVISRVDEDTWNDIVTQLRK